MIKLSDSWAAQIPEASVGLLVLTGVPNVTKHPALTVACKELEQELLKRYAALDRTALRKDPVLAAYDAFFRPFRKTYHVQLQLESVVFKGKAIFSPSALVTAMFLAELKTGLLTAAHDLMAVQLPLLAGIAAGEESYQRFDGTYQQLKKGDLYIRDQQGILSSVIYGPDRRTQIRPDTDRAIFTTYGPPGISKNQVNDQLTVLETFVKLFAPQAERLQLMVI